MRLNKNIFEGTSIYLVGSALFICILLLLVITEGHTGSFLLLNEIHTIELDIFFTKVTFLGDGLFAVALVLFILLFASNKKIGFQLLIAFLLSGLIAQCMKAYFAMPRPFEILGSGSYPYFLEGITNKGWKSFPSGHTTTIFSITTTLAFLFRKSWIQVCLLALASLIGYSRIYLGCHFLSDVLVGAVVGILSSFLVVKIKHVYAFILDFVSRKKWSEHPAIDNLTNLNAP